MQSLVVSRRLYNDAICSKGNAAPPRSCAARWSKLPNNKRKMPSTTNDPVCAALSHQQQDLSKLCAAVAQNQKFVWRVWKLLRCEQEVNYPSTRWLKGSQVSVPPPGFHSGQRSGSCCSFYLLTKVLIDLDSWRAGYASTWSLANLCLPGATQNRDWSKINRKHFSFHHQELKTSWCWSAHQLTCLRVLV